MGENGESEEADGDKLENVFAESDAEHNLDETLESIQSIREANQAAFEQITSALIDEINKGVSQPLELLAQTINEGVSRQFEELAEAVSAGVALDSAMAENPIKLPEIENPVLDPELFDQFGSYYFGGPLPERVSHLPEGGVRESITPQEWFEMGLESGHIVSCGNCGAVALRENSHRYLHQEGRGLLCPRCGDTGRGIQ